MKKLFLIDGNAILHRAYHALPTTMKTAKGETVNAVYGFSSMLLNLLNLQKPDYMVASFDLKAKTFRHEEYKEYKATRVKAPDDLYAQIDRIKEVVRAFEIPIFELEGYEADDVLGTLTKLAQPIPELCTYLVTGDMDSCQLVDEKTFMLLPHKGFKETVIFDTPQIIAKYGILPSQIPDLKGLMGDSSDNIKGVAGIGPKTASKLIAKYGSVENVYENIEEIEEKVKQKLILDKESAYLSKRLATIIRDIPLDFDLEKCKTHEYDREKVMNLFLELEFKSLLAKLKAFNRDSDDKVRESSGQQSLF